MSKNKSKSCWDCAHKIGGKYCPLERKVESALRVRFLKVREDSKNDEEAIRKLTSGKISVRVTDGENEAVRLIDLSEKEARERVENKEKGDPHGPYLGKPCENWVAEEPYTIEEMMEISDEASRGDRHRGRSSEEVARYKRLRGCGKR